MVTWESNCMMMMLKSKTIFQNIRTVARVMITMMMVLLLLMMIVMLRRGDLLPVVLFSAWDD